MAGVKGTDVGKITSGGKAPSGGGQTSGASSRARSGMNVAGKGETLNGFPGVNAKSQGGKQKVTGQTGGTTAFPKTRVGSKQSIY